MMQFKQITLDNGLEVISEVNPNAFSMSLGYFVKTGSRDESMEVAGVSHFLEHMLFKGTPRRTSVDVNRQLDDLGSQSNAFTSEEQTVYYMSVLPENQFPALDLLTDMMRPSLRDEDFQTEKQVILEEIAMYDDQPPYGAMERAMEEYFGDHPLSTRVLGTKESVSELTAEAMREYHRARYAPNNLCLVASGAVDFDALVRETQKMTKLWQPASARRKLSTPVPQSKQIQMVHPPATQQYTLEFSQGPGYMDQARYVTRILATVLGDDSGSRLFWELVDKGLADAAVCYTYEFQDCGVFGLYLAGDPQQQQDNWDLIQSIVSDSNSNPITERELELAKNKICSGILLAAERPSNRLFSVGGTWLSRHQYETAAQVSQHYRSVTLDEVQEAFESLKDRKAVRVSVGPEIES
ncbi:MAG: M16 family metallopeptidase [Planctomycetota bacterium]|jgi:predicted Zn-dependent peptidase